MQSTLAREIIAQALEDETYEGDIPDDDDKAVEVAAGLVTMAEDAWAQNIQGPEVEAILKLAATDDDASANGDGGEDEKPAAKKKPGRPGKKEPEPDPEPEEDPRASEEPWENYDADKVAEIVEGIEVWGEQEEFDSVQHILIYESANKNRKKIVEAAEAVLPEEMLPGAAATEPDPEPEPDDDPEPEPEPEPSTATEEPYEGYDESKVVEIKSALKEYLEDDDEETTDEDKLATLKQTFDYESLNKNRTGLLDFLDEAMTEVKERIDGDEAGASEEEGEAEGAAASSDDSGDEEGAEGGEGDSKKAGPAAGKRSRSSSASSDDSSSEDDDAEYASLLTSVHELIDRERLHVPPAIESDPVDLPFDLTTVSDTELQQLFSAFTAYSYRSGYLLMIQEASEHRCKEAADEIVEAFIANAEGDSLTQIKAVAEQHDEVKRWRKLQRKHGILALSLRKERDNYDKVCERLSRVETMRQDEWQRAGGGPTARSRPGAKK